MRVLVIGPGYIGSELVARLVGQRHAVSALGRSAGNKSDLVEAGVKVFQADVTEPDSLQDIPREWDWVAYCVSSSRGTLEDYAKVYLEGTKNVLDWLSPTPPKAFVYTSSTGVYAQNDGSVVTEDSPTEPESETGKILVATEKLLLNAARERGFPAVILRVSGIYGPGRGYWLKQFQSGEARIEGAGDRMLNMIHRDDVVGAMIAALEKGKHGEIYNVTDDEPVTQLEMFKWLSARLQKPLPPALGDGGVGERKRAATNKRVSNARLKSELGYRLKFPTFREGFEGLLAPA